MHEQQISLVLQYPLKMGDLGCFILYILLPKFLLMNCQELILFERLTQWVDLIFLSLISSHDTLKEHEKENLQKQIIFSPLASCPVL